MVHMDTLARHRFEHASIVLLVTDMAAELSAKQAFVVIVNEHYVHWLCFKGDVTPRAA